LLVMSNKALSHLEIQNPSLISSYLTSVKYKEQCGTLQLYPIL
jgi:hypothetical protein